MLDENFDTENNEFAIYFNICILFEERNIWIKKGTHYDVRKIKNRANAAVFINFLISTGCIYIYFLNS